MYRRPTARTIPTSHPDRFPARPARYAVTLDGLLCHLGPMLFWYARTRASSRRRRDRCRLAGFTPTERVFEGFVVSSFVAESADRISRRSVSRAPIPICGTHPVRGVEQRAPHCRYDPTAHRSQAVLAVYPVPRDLAARRPRLLPRSVIRDRGNGPRSLSRPTSAFVLRPCTATVPRARRCVRSTARRFFSPSAGFPTSPLVDFDALTVISRVSPRRSPLVVDDAAVRLARADTGPAHGERGHVLCCQTLYRRERAGPSTSNSPLTAVESPTEREERPVLRG